MPSSFPNSHHNRSWQFIVIRDPKIKENLYKLLEQGFLKQAPVLIIILIDTLKTENPVQDISVASENIMIQAASLGLGTVWKNIPEDKSPEVKKMLEIPDNFLCINIIPVGYIKTPRKPHNDKDFDLKKIHFDKF